MSEVNFGNDGDFSDRALIYKVNANLANELGNLCQRTLSLLYKNCQGVVPNVDIGAIHDDNDAGSSVLTQDDRHLLQTAYGLRNQTGVAIANQAIQRYVESLVSMIWDTNKYIDEMAPWSLRKTDFARMETVLYVILEVLRISSILYQPLIPTSASMILDQLKVPDDARTFRHLTLDFRISPGAVMDKPVPIFPRIEVPEQELVQT
jgi:methionyl-tRNA synthetase